jgi:hypothetical protein
MQLPRRPAEHHLAARFVTADRCIDIARRSHRRPGGQPIEEPGYAQIELVSLLG